MIDKNKQYRTRDGREVRIYATDAGMGQNIIHGATHDGEFGWVPHVWMPDGSHERISFLDLIEVKPRHKRTVWLNVFDNGSILTFDSPEIYDVHRRIGLVARIRVDLDFEEGQGL